MLQVSSYIGHGESTLTTSFLCPNSLQEAEKLEKDFESCQSAIEVGGFVCFLHSTMLSLSLKCSYTCNHASSTTMIIKHASLAYLTSILSKAFVRVFFLRLVK